MSVGPGLGARIVPSVPWGISGIRTVSPVRVTWQGQWIPIIVKGGVTVR